MTLDVLRPIGNIICGLASEEEDVILSHHSQDENKQNKYIVLIDPLDGSFQYSC
jgi:fructose-1,6-bisphosphatase I